MIDFTAGAAREAVAQRHAERHVRAARGTGGSLDSATWGLYSAAQMWAERRPQIPFPPHLVRRTLPCGSASYSFGVPMRALLFAALVSACATTPTLPQSYLCVIQSVPVQQARADVVVLRYRCEPERNQ